MTFPIGAVIKISIGYFLAGNPNFGIIGSPIGTLACFIVISALNIGFIMKRVKDKPKFSVVFVKPLLCSAIMAAVAYLLYALLVRLGSGIIGDGRMAVTLYLAIAIAVSIAVYAILIIISRTITAEDMKLVPKGEKLAKVLRLK
jgi:stage V sporulation protein B